MGGNFGGQQQSNQPKKLITFDSKTDNTGDDFGGFQEAKAKDPVKFCLIRPLKTIRMQKLI